VLISINKLCDLTLNCISSNKMCYLKLPTLICFPCIMIKYFILCVLDRASSWYLNKGRPTWWHLLYYVNLLLNMFQMLIHLSSGACDYLVRYCVGCIVLTWGVLVLCSGIVCWWCGIRVPAEPLVVQTTLRYHITNNQSRCLTLTHLKSAQYSLHNNAPNSRKLLKIDVLTSETRWAVNWHNKASVIKLVYLYSNKYFLLSGVEHA